MGGQLLNPRSEESESCQLPSVRTATEMERRDLSAFSKDPRKVSSPLSEGKAQSQGRSTLCPIYDRRTALLLALASPKDPALHSYTQHVTQRPPCGVCGAQETWTAQKGERLGSRNPWVNPWTISLFLK